MYITLLLCSYFHQRDFTYSMKFQVAYFGLSYSWVRKIPWRRDRLPLPVFLGFPCGSAGKESAYNVGDLGSVPGLGRSPGVGNGKPLQDSCLENSIDRRNWQATVPRVINSHVWLFVTPWTIASRLLCLWKFPSKDTGAGCHFLLQGIFPAQGSNPHIPQLLQRQADSLPLSHLGSPWVQLWPPNPYVAPEPQKVNLLGDWFLQK